MYKFTPATITNQEELLEQLRVIREKGVAMESEENEVGIFCLATPVRNYTGRAIWSISVSGPTNRMLEKDIEKLSEVLRKTGQAVSAQMGYTHINKTLQRS